MVARTTEPVPAMQHASQQSQSRESRPPLPRANIGCADHARGELRQATEHAHRDLHKNSSFIALITGSLARNAYQALLLRLLAGLAPLERSIHAQQSSQWLTWYPRHRGDRIGS